MCLPALAALAPALGAAGTAGAGAALAGGAAAGAAAGAGLSAGILGTGLSAAQLLTVGGSVLGAGQQLAQGVAQKQAARFNEQLARREALVSATRTTLEQQELAGRQRKVAAAQNVAAVGQGRTLTGSALDVVQESNLLAEQDVLASLYGGGVNAARAAGNIQLAKQSGRGALLGAGLGAGGTLLTGLSRARMLS